MTWLIEPQSQAWNIPPVDQGPTVAIAMAVRRYIAEEKRRRVALEDVLSLVRFVRSDRNSSDTGMWETEKRSDWRRQKQQEGPWREEEEE